MGDLAQQFGASMRFHSSLPKKLNEMAIIITARRWTAEYEWSALGYYQLVSMLLNVDRYLLAAGEKPELQALK